MYNFIYKINQFIVINTSCDLYLLENTIFLILQTKNKMYFEIILYFHYYISFIFDLLEIHFVKLFVSK